MKLIIFITTNDNFISAENKAEVITIRCKKKTVLHIYKSSEHLYWKKLIQMIKKSFKFLVNIFSFI